MAVEEHWAALLPGDTSLKQFGRCSSKQKCEFILLVLVLRRPLPRISQQMNLLVGNRRPRDVWGLLAGNGAGW